MTLLVTVDQARAHLRIDNVADDDDIELKVEAASAAVLSYIGDTQYLFLDTSGDPIDLEDTSPDLAGLRALHTCRQATLMLVAEWFSNREAVAGDFFFAATTGYGYLPRPVMALLYPLRDPTIA